jgi:DNA polymerase III epsilon subunit-like protein
MTRIVFIDTETTSLRHDRRAWEIGLIVRDEFGREDDHRWFIGTEDLDLGNADLTSLNVGRFYERHPDATPVRKAGVPGAYEVAHPEAFVLHQVEKLTRGAHLVGAVPNFDADVLGARMRAHGICPSWHYHLVCVENLAAGWLAAYAAYLDRDGTVAERAAERAAELRRIAAPPWKSDELSRAVGVEPDESERHTALGDARWARDIYDAVMRGGVS